MSDRENELEPICPGEILRKDFMTPLGISIKGLARRIGVYPARVSQVVSGKRAITANTALRLARYFGNSPEFWLNLQSDYQLRLARRTTWPAVAAKITPHAGEHFPPQGRP